jgi:hypothetical protein
VQKDFFNSIGHQEIKERCLDRVRFALISRPNSARVFVGLVQMRNGGPIAAVEQKWKWSSILNSGTPLSMAARISRKLERS